MSGEPLIHAFHGDRAYAFSRSAEHSHSVFGGPLEADISGAETLHSIARLSSTHLPAVGALSELPLVFGLRHSGCRLRYRVESGGTIAILELLPPLPADDFPYRGYPALLPFVPLDVEEEAGMSFERFAARLPQKPPPPSSTSAEKIVIAVPPPAGLGVTLWGLWGDLEGVTIFFECDPASRVVSAVTACT